MSKKKIYIAIFREISDYKVEVLANNEEEARKIADENYNNGYFELESETVELIGII